MGPIEKRFDSIGTDRVWLEGRSQQEKPAHEDPANDRLLAAPHSAENGHDDPYLRPAFTFRNKVRRAFWTISWFVLFLPSPVPLFGWRSFLLRRFGARIGSRNFIYPSARIWAPWLLETEAVVTIGRGAEVYNPGGVVLRQHSIISQEAYLCGASHNYNDPNFPFQSKRIVLEPYSWVCARAIVLPGVTIGEGAVLGAGSVTARSLVPWWVYAGNPAKQIKPRNQTERG